MATHHVSDCTFALWKTIWRAIYWSFRYGEIQH